MIHNVIPSQQVYKLAGIVNEIHVMLPWKVTYVAIA